MVRVKRLVLDVLKPHRPDGLVFSKAIAEQGEGWHVVYAVEEVDEKTESVTVIIEGEDIQFERIAGTIEEIGGSVHSIDEVEVVNEPTGH
jgi:hypothetical protein